MSELKLFLQSEMRKRDLSMRQFASLIGVSHATISRLVDPANEEYNVSLEFLLKLSKATDTSLVVLLKMVDPSIAVEADELSASAYLTAQRIEEAPDDIVVGGQRDKEAATSLINPSGRALFIIEIKNAPRLRARFLSPHHRSITKAPD